MPKKVKNDNTIIYQTKSGALELRGDVSRETLWATQAQMAEIFGVTPQNITLHLKAIYREKELSESATCKEFLQVQKEGNREVRRQQKLYDLEAIISVGYRINSILGTKFRQWATKTLRGHITKGYTINPKVVSRHYEEFQKVVADIRTLLPSGAAIDTASVFELVNVFADTWFSLDAYDRDALPTKGATKRRVALTAEKLSSALSGLKGELVQKGEATEIFGTERGKGNVEGIVGNVLQAFGGSDLYPTIEEKAAHLLYFMVKNHPFVDGNKRSGAYAFVWFLRMAKLLDTARLTPPALTALTLLVAESDPKDKDRMIRLVLALLATKR